MTDDDPKDILSRYLHVAHEAVLWKLDGVSDYDARRPLTPTGTNLLGLVKHLAAVEAGYLGDTFGRPFPEAQSFSEDDPEADLYATADETREGIVALYHRVWTHSDETIATHELDSMGRVPWWPEERAHVSLHRVLVHLVAEINRHAGHADILRETIDGAAGLRIDNTNLGTDDPADRGAHYDRLEALARQFR